MKRILLLLVLLLPAPALALEANGTIVFLTDFGTSDDAVAICKGVMLTTFPGARIVDLTHQVTPYDIREGAIYLGETAGFYPKGTVFLGVVDPGVGTERKSVAIETADGYA
ncbi:MAG: SAM-dependent chlorinase/fluorinase, partial [Candidatus Methylomirabilis sp.]|nr:SAM-dependent chlorinase/fluorinase [Deltaproteobacteria bacterium]